MYMVQIQLAQSLPSKRLKPGLPLHEGPIVMSKGFDGIDTTKIRRILEESFGKALVQSYFDEHPQLVLMKGQGIAIVKSIEDTPYLDKFSVSPQSQGNGIGREIWKHLRSLFSQLIWRASVENPLNPWYVAQSDGFQGQGKWIVFWYGADFSHLVDKVANKPETLEVAS